MAIAGLASKLELRIYQSASGNCASKPLTLSPAIADIAAKLKLRKYQFGRNACNGQ